VSTIERAVSVIGLGPMGAAFARALIDGGHELTVWNRTASRAVPLVALGANAATSAGEAIRASPMTVVVLADTDTTKEVLSHDPAALEGRLIVNFSAGRPEQAVALQRWVAERGGEYLDGRIGAYPRRIGGDRANIIVAGPRQVYERALPVLRHVGTDTRLISDDVAAANAVSMSMTSVFHHVALAGFLEAAAFADRYGVSVTEWMSMAEPMVELTREAIAEAGRQCTSGSYEQAQASIDTHLAAVVLARDAMVERGADHALVDATLGYLERARTAGHGDSEFAVLFELLRATPGSA
jgi:3-hydroxyisobutyrate dehydrogenase-like beta-hydroxyacid dehydrogenase